MSDHDPLCPYTGTMHSVTCECPVIRRARADEREQAVRRAENATTQHEFCLTDGTVFDTLVSLNEVCQLINPGGDGA